jgi:hypothetical protein
VRFTNVGIQALGGNYCENHFMCMGCFSNLSDFSRTKFMDFDTKPFCQRCFDQVPSDSKKNMTRYREKEKEWISAK